MPAGGQKSEVSDTPEAAVTRACEPPDVGDENVVQVFCKSNTCP